MAHVFTNKRTILCYHVLTPRRLASERGVRRYASLFYSFVVYGRVLDRGSANTASPDWSRPRRWEARLFLMNAQHQHLHQEGAWMVQGQDSLSSWKVLPQSHHFRGRLKRELVLKHMCCIK